MFALRPPSAVTLQRLLVQESKAQTTYREVGATAATLPGGYKHERISQSVGQGRSAFERCCTHLDTWGIQKDVGFKVFPAESHVATGTTALLTLPIGPLHVVASVRIVYTIDEADRHGFAYGTLPEHPEIGEEYFGVTIDENANVRFELAAFSVPGARLAKLGGPITKRLQRSATDKYVRSVERVATATQ